MTAIAVIGSNFGDEGKGRMTDHFASQGPSVVVRFNGGAQAGHTVVTPEGKRHVFSHFGSGTFCGAPTFLSHFFIVNPFLFAREARLLPGAKVYVDPMAPITAPWDMLINREIERNRGAGRHGSCGYGVSETVQRMMSDRRFHTHANLMSSPTELRTKLEAIRSEYVPGRLKDLGIKTPSDWYQKSSKEIGLVDEYMNDCEVMSRSCTPMLSFELSKRWDRIIFEGAQGLCLDEGHHFFPHVTRSRTGLANVSELCRIAGIKKIEACYITRAYMTRHGAGPFPTEDVSLRYEDPTNVPNEFQGSIRFGHLDIDLFSESIKNDAKNANGIEVHRTLAVTCLDQVGDNVRVRRNGIDEVLKTADLPNVLRMAVSALKVYVSKRESRTQ